jgi:RNA polymerase sigma-70 factor (ECF subfamily)
VDGSGLTFEDAFRAEYVGVVRTISPIVGSVEDAEALTQDAFVKAYTHWKRIGGYDRPGAWIRRVAIRDAVRFADRHPQPVTDPPHQRDATEPVAGSLDLDDAIRRLPPKQRACVVLHYLADWPVGDVAEAIGCREATVRVHLHRARGALAAALEPAEQEMNDGR